MHSVNRALYISCIIEKWITRIIFLIPVSKLSEFSLNFLSFPHSYSLLITHAHSPSAQTDDSQYSLSVCSFLLLYWSTYLFFFSSNPCSVFLFLLFVDLDFDLRPHWDLNKNFTKLRSQQNEKWFKYISYTWYHM
jgi:hypothetical protein